MKAILVIDIDNLDIENTQVTYIELQCNNQTRQISLVNHWLKPMPEKKSHKEYSWNAEKVEITNDYEDGWNDCIEELEK